MVGLIERYRDRLPFAPDGPRRLAPGGLDAARARRAGLRAGRGRGVAQARGRQPDRLVQGPRDDVRGLGRRARGRRGGDLRLDRQHRRERRRLRRARRADRRGDRARGQDRHRQARPGADARRAGDRAARQLRRGAGARARAGRGAIRSRSSTRSTRSGSRARRRRPSSSSTSSGDELDALCIPVGNAGNITAYWKGFEEAGARPRMLGWQAEGAAPLVHGAPVEHPETVASAIRIGNPARWEEAMGAMAASHGAIRAVSRRRDPRRLPLPRRARGRVLRAGLGRGRGRAAQARRRGRAGGSRACSPGTG